MAVVVRSQPQGLTRIGSRNPITKGLIAAVTPFNSASAVRGSLISVIGSTDHRGMPACEFFGNGNSGSTTSVFIPVPTTTSAEWTFLVIGSSKKSGNFEAIADFNDGLASPNFRTSLAAGAYGSGNIGIDSRPYAPDYNSNTSWISAKRNILLLTISAAKNELRLYFNRQLISTSALSSTSAAQVSRIQLFSKNGTNYSDPSNAGTAS